jgi:hypothetical protein
MTRRLYVCTMERDPHDRRLSVSDRERGNAALHEVLPALIALLVVQGSLVWLDPDPSSTWKLLWSLSPIVPAVWLVWAQWRALRRADEYQRTIQLEAMAVGFAAMLVASFLGGLLDAADVGSPSQSLQITFMAGTIGWLVPLVLRSGRER